MFFIFVKTLKEIFNFLRLKKSICSYLSITSFETKRKNKKMSDIFLHLLKKYIKKYFWILLSYGIFEN